MDFIVSAVLTLGVTGIIGSVLLYAIARKFEVYEDPKMAEVQDALPAANCGGCGYPGCSGFASACVQADTLEGLYCPAGGAETMARVAEILGKTIENTNPLIAVVRCNGSCSSRPRTNRYDGASSCALVATMYGGETDCSYGCLGMGDCMKACMFDALQMNPETLLPEVNDDKCTACGACVKACPKILIQLRKKGVKSRRIYVNCMNKDKGGIARKACSVACIGCSKCQKACPFEAISMANNLAYIDDDKCRLCRKCVGECPTSAIAELNFPPRKGKEENITGDII